MIAEWVSVHDPDARLAEREHLWSIALDVRGGCAVLRRIARGTRQSVEVEVQAVLWVPLIASSRRFVIAHNHPDGNLYPTAEDMALTRRIMEAAGICGLVLADHVILGPQGSEYSLLKHGLIEREHPVAVSASPAGHEITGTLELPEVLGSVRLFSRSGPSCTAIGDYSDINGATVTIKDRAGMIIGTGTLGPGTCNTSATVCNFPFRIATVQPSTSYTFQVSGRGALTYTAKEMADTHWFVAFRMGSPKS